MEFYCSWVVETIQPQYDSFPAVTTNRGYRELFLFCLLLTHNKWYAAAKAMKNSGIWTRLASVEAIQKFEIVIRNYRGFVGRFCEWNEVSFLNEHLMSIDWDGNLIQYIIGFPTWVLWRKLHLIHFSKNKLFEKVSFVHQGCMVNEECRKFQISQQKDSYCKHEDTIIRSKILS